MILDWEVFWKEFETWMATAEDAGHYHEWPEQQQKIQELVETKIKWMKR